jgi:ComF family protein
MCSTRGFKFDTAYTAGVYEGVLREMILAFKYKRRRDILADLTGFMQGAVLGRIPRERIDLVVPVPLHGSRERSRGFNQAELLARPLATAIGVPLEPECFQRIRATDPQVGQSFSARKKNVKDAFKVTRPAVFKGRGVMLVDDVMTTGATASECARTLKEAGAREVHLAVIARAGEEKLVRS